MVKSYPHCSQKRLEDSFESPQFGQSTITPAEEDAAGEEAAAAARSMGVEGGTAGGVAAGGAVTDPPPIGAPHVSHHSGSPLW